MGDDPAMANVLSRVFHEEMEKVSARMMPKMARIYAETFTEQELADMLAFYQSPTGRKVVEKLPELSRRGQQIVAPMLPELQRDIVVGLFDGYCEVHACTSDQHKTMEQVKQRVLDQLKVQEVEKLRATT